jgi:PAS domain S-box-containing protein
MTLRKNQSLRLIFFFIALTFTLTIIVVFAWEKALMKPLYSYFDHRYPGPAQSDFRWRMAQRVEHFFISVTVDVVVVTLLLRLVDKQQRKLRASEARYRALFEHAGDGIGIVALGDHHLVDANRRFVEMLGFGGQSLAGYHVCEVLNIEVEGSRGPVSSRLLGCRIDEGMVLETWQGVRDVALITKSGDRIPVLISASSLTTDDESLLIVWIRDLTEQKKLQREAEVMQLQLFQSSKLASIGELAAGVAHEINNPLNCIMNFAQLLEEDGVAQSETHRRMVTGILDEGGRIARIVRDLLTFSRRDPHVKAAVSIPEVIRNSISLFGRQLERDGISVEVRVDDDLMPVVADASRLRQVVVNMISNARHALRNRQDEARLFQISAWNVRERESQRVRIEFYDNGAGIAREHLDKVFDPFFTTRRDNGGTGLGLSMSFGIIRGCDGTITVESEQGSYTRFIVELPAAIARIEEYANSTAGGRRA